uniref:tRNA (guanine(37)-N1)-methyltransferase n=1 Tax=Kwoniella dejecticola CBS 10117 TaxID=1296121 RepID=A0A1A5ZX62_9TREE|nr:tRNA (guanine37-N1)-methyltransferase [Kwoniella dejecticola CBS 10117]OBR82400.1 tRNA (guanine37-N1)-methyltransferase [Kwoniella dejecticola CBS 10117]
MSAPASSSSSKPFGALAEYMLPPQHIGMQTLDRSSFDREVPVLAVAVEASKVGKIRPHPALKGQILDLPRVKPIVEASNGEKGVKWIRLHATSEGQLPKETKEFVRNETSGLRKETVRLGYDNWNTSEILSAVLPTTKSDDIPSSFTSTGHIAHMNLREEWLPFRYLIGQVILDKNPGLRTVVNKLDTIHVQYRYFDMEVIAGEKDYITTLNESNCIFTFDFSLVYWNSRLHHEHERLIESFKPNSLIADVMAGVGPFAVPAAKRGGYVLGNDLNPESVKWMRENRVKNHVQNNLRIFEQDGSAFIQSAALEAWRNPFIATIPHSAIRKKQRDDRKKREAQAKLQQEENTITKDEQKTATLPGPELPEPPKIIQHFIMNLPDSALAFLHSYNGCFSPLLAEESFVKQYGDAADKLREEDMPLVHVYCFTREIEADKAQVDILKRGSDDLGYQLSPSSPGYHLHHVRSVAPNKDMYCLTFRLPKEVAFKPI